MSIEELSATPPYGEAVVILHCLEIAESWEGVKEGHVSIYFPDVGRHGERTALTLLANALRERNARPKLPIVRRTLRLLAVSRIYASPQDLDMLGATLLDAACNRLGEG